MPPGQQALRKAGRCYHKEYFSMLATGFTMTAFFACFSIVLHFWPTVQYDIALVVYYSSVRRCDVSACVCPNAGKKKNRKNWFIILLFTLGAKKSGTVLCEDHSYHHHHLILLIPSTSFTCQLFNKSFWPSHRPGHTKPDHLLSSNHDAAVSAPEAKGKHCTDRLFKHNFWDSLIGFTGPRTTWLLLNLSSQSFQSIASSTNAGVNSRSGWSGLNSFFHG